MMFEVSSALVFIKAEKVGDFFFYVYNYFSDLPITKSK